MSKAGAHMQLAAAAVAVAAFVVWALVPPGDAVEKGRTLVAIDVREIGPGNILVRPFTLSEDFALMTLSYNITQAQHVRVAAIDPMGVRHEAAVVPPDCLDLAVEAPEQGRWEFEVRTLEGADAGSIEAGRFLLLGFKETPQRLLC